MDYEKTESGFPAVQLKPKPRKLRQTWIKAVGYHEAPHYLESMGLPQLKCCDFSPNCDLKMLKLLDFFENLGRTQHLQTL